MLLFNKRYNKYFQLFSAYFIYSIAGVLSKSAATSESVNIFTIIVAFQIFTLGIYAIVWQQILKKFSLITAMSCRGVVVILSLIWATVIFNETVTIFNIIGSLVIVVGIYIVSSDDRAEPGI